MRTIDGVAGLRELAGSELGVSSWLRIEQRDIDAFAADTGDDNWLHVDPERARETPYGGTIAHGLLTLSLGPRFSYEIYSIEGISHGVNYGYGKVRFPAPVPVGSELRMRAELAAVDGVKGGVQLTVLQTFEVRGGEKPACVAESLLRVFS